MYCGDEGRVLGVMRGEGRGAWFGVVREGACCNEG